MKLCELDVIIDHIDDNIDAISLMHSCQGDKQCFISIFMGEYLI